MTKPETGSEILPVDRRGRVRVSPQRREQLLDEFEKSKLSGQQFAKLTGLKYSTIAAWAAERRRQRAASAPALPPASSTTVQWLETIVEQGGRIKILRKSAVATRLGLTRGQKPWNKFHGYQSRIATRLNLGEI